MFKAAKEGPQKVVTANRLIDGLVIFVGPGETWVNSIADAELLADGGAVDAAMAFGQAEILARRVTELYPIDVTVENGIPVPVRLRERIRAQGPSVVYGDAELEKLGVVLAGR